MEHVHKTGEAKLSATLFPNIKPNSKLFTLTGKYNWFWARLHTGHGPWRKSLFKKKLVEDDRCVACRKNGVLVDGEPPIEDIDHIFTCTSCPKKCAAREEMINRSSSDGSSSSSRVVTIAVPNLTWRYLFNGTQLKTLNENGIPTWDLPHRTPEERINFFLCKSDLGSSQELVPVPKIMATRYLRDSGIFDLTIPSPGDLPAPPLVDYPSTPETSPVPDPVPDPVPVPVPDPLPVSNIVGYPESTPELEMTSGDSASDEKEPLPPPWWSSARFPDTPLNMNLNTSPDLQASSFFFEARYAACNIASPLPS